MADIPDKTVSNPWKTFLSTGGLGLLSISGGIYLYFDLANWEQTGGTRLMNPIVSALYHTLGKVGVLGVSVLHICTGKELPIYRQKFEGL